MPARFNPPPSPSASGGNVKPPPDIDPEDTATLRDALAAAAAANLALLHKETERVAKKQKISVEKSEEVSPPPLSHLPLNDLDPGARCGNTAGWTPTLRPRGGRPTPHRCPLSTTPQNEIISRLLRNFRRSSMRSSTRFGERAPNSRRRLRLPRAAGSSASYTRRSRKRTTPHR